MPTPHILAVNIGSSSLKFALYAFDAPHDDLAPTTFSGSYEGLEPGGEPQLHMTLVGERRMAALRMRGNSPMAAALADLQARVGSHLGANHLLAVSHRIVHGGTRYVEPVVLDDALLAELDALAPLAPLHQPHNLAGVRAFMQAMPRVPQVGCFDTAFHHSQADLETRFALPRALHDQGVRRYGFHGLSYDYVSGWLQTHTVRGNGRVVMAHLGNGASLCATRHGQSVATTMGFSALDGLMMGTRCGTLDAGVVLHLLSQGLDHDALVQLLYSQSGLLGVSGISADMRKLHQSQAPEAREAVELFVHRAVREAGGLIAVLQGLDVLAFTGGIGEHDAAVRAAMVQGLGFLGLRLDEAVNAQADGSGAMAIHAADSSAEIWVIPTDEGRVAARAAWSLLGPQAA